ncbi:hypothetical protein R1sor_026171 [Riccia sorocarpa]|uniref:Uncharacterized protein n=1 Tax=Riccia sorocarpa TaxID=122646 RepID=A0ABD3GB94_9MARC
MQVSLGPRLVDANVCQELKSKLAALTTNLAESERSRTCLHARVEALKAELIQSSERTATEAAVSTGLLIQKELQQVKQEASNAKTTISKLETDLKVARKDVATQTEGEDKLKVQLRSLTGQMEVLKAESAAKLAKLQQDHTVLQQQLQTEKAAVGKFKAALQTEVQKISNLEQQIVSLKEDIESHKFSADRAERASLVCVQN